MKKRILSLLLVLLMVVSLVPTAVLAEDDIVAYEVTGGNIYFNKSTGEITECDKSVTEAVIPSEIDGVKVTNIGEYAFSGCTGLTSINVAEGNASYSSNDGVLFNKEKTKLVRYPEGKTAASYTIPDNVTSIEPCAFYGCTSLASVTIPNSVTSIGNGAFINCYDLTDITIPNSVTSIGFRAFYNCVRLESITIPNSVTSIATNAFGGCTSLTSITIPDSVTSIGRLAFERCTGLTSINVTDANMAYCSDNGILFNKDKTELIQYPEGKTDTSYVICSGVTNIGELAFINCIGLTSITIPNSVESIDNNAFSGCTGLTSITIPNSVVSIDYNAFSGCTGLTSITIPKSVENIDNSAFSRCTGLTSINVHDANTVYSSDEGVLFNKDKTELVLYPEGRTDAFYTVPDSVTSIGDSAFKSCKSLTSITMSSSVTNIGRDAFDGCTGLTSVTIPDSVKYIGNNAFCGCTSMTSVTIPDSVTDISFGTFQNCESLTSVTISDGVRRIGSCAFSNCTGLTSITIPDSVMIIRDNAFLDCSSLTDVYYTGSEEQWNTINIERDNEALTNATIHCTGETHTHNYVDGACTICGAKDPNYGGKHNYTKEVTEPTCTEEGYTTYTCTLCSYSYTSDKTPATGHSPELRNAVESTCTEAGYTGDEVCTICGDVLSQGEVIEATGHHFKGNTCTVCGDTRSTADTIRAWFQDTISTVKNLIDKLFGRI